MSSAEQEFRTAFERLKSGSPNVLEKGTKVTQNNIAREAGKEPSSFKKSRYPSLIAEIQSYLIAFDGQPAASGRQALLKTRRKNRSLKERLRDIESERDHALSLLLSADSTILELYQRISDLEATLPQSRVTSLHSDNK